MLMTFHLVLKSYFISRHQTYKSRDHLKKYKKSNTIHAMYCQFYIQTEMSLQRHIPFATH